MKKCKVKKCVFPDYYAKGLCHSHYEMFWKYGRLTKKSNKCSYKPCKKMIWGKYCKFHQVRIDNNISMDTPKGWQVKGKRNVNWKGGVSDYPNHHLMKKNRIIVFKKYNGKCADCVKKAQQIHHKDNSKDNHSLKNLVPLCIKCHGIRGRGRKNSTSLFMRKYGMTIFEIVKKTDMTENYVYKFHKMSVLKYILLKFYGIDTRQIKVK